MGFYRAKIHHHDTVGMLAIIVGQIIQKPFEIDGNKPEKVLDGLQNSGNVFNGLQGKFVLFHSYFTWENVVIRKRSSFVILNVIFFFYRKFFAKTKITWGQCYFTIQYKHRLFRACHRKWTQWLTCRVKGSWQCAHYCTFNSASFHKATSR